MRIDYPIRVDGRLDEAVWDEAEPATDFVTLEPTIGEKPRYPTKIRILYDDNAVYIGAEMFDPYPDSISRQLGIRDAGEGNTDLLWIGIDSYHDLQSMFLFGVSAANVQSDGRNYLQDFDFEYDAVWDSRVEINQEGWVAEIRIPYSALRFKDQEVQTWGINFIRVVWRYREKYAWNPMDPNQEGIASQAGELVGIKGINVPVRLSLTPYISAYAEHFPLNVPGESNWGRSLRGGMDLKYGITESFTLDMTLVPDFGQVKSDNEVLNLTPFETKYDENRPFFTEGTELFQKAGIFYSRRIGGMPVGHLDVYNQLNDGEVVIDNPRESQLLNATKVTGRTGGNLGIGVFNAVSGRTYATVEDTAAQTTRQVLTQPLSNYNVLVLDQALKNNSYITFTNTNVWRQGSYEDANVSALNFQVREKTNTYGATGSFVLSQNNLGDGVPGADLGFKYNWSVAKVSGKFQASFGQWVESDTYDPNDLGFLYSPNDFNHKLNLKYSQNQPVGIFRNFFGSLNISYNQLYKPRTFTELNIFGFSYFTFRNLLTAGIHGGGSPVDGYDYFEPRVDGMKFRQPKNYGIGGFISTDYRKSFALDMNAGFWKVPEYQSTSLDVSFRPRFRFNDRFSLFANMSYNWAVNFKGFAAFDSTGNPVFGNRNRRTVIHSLAASYIFTSRMGINLNVRHYWSRADYDMYYSLLANGNLQPVSFDPQADINFNAFNVDLVYNWEFTPGSELILTWKNAIYSGDSENGYFNNFMHTLQSDQKNTFSVKLLYYFDYQRLFRS